MTRSVLPRPRPRPSHGSATARPVGAVVVWGAAMVVTALVAAACGDAPAPGPGLVADETPSVVQARPSTTPEPSAPEESAALAADPGGAVTPADERTRRVLDELEFRFGRVVPGGRLAVAVQRLDSDRLLGLDAERMVISASVAKVWWTAAALDAGRYDEAAAQAEAVFADSSDVAAATMIDLAGGPDAVNAATERWAMADTGLVRWVSDRVQESAAGTGPLGTSNHTTAADAVRFLHALAAGTALGPADTFRLRTWMTWSPRSAADGPPVASTLTHALPVGVQATAQHKAGWLFAGDHPGQGMVLDMGIVSPPGEPGAAYAVALVAESDDHQAAAVAFLTHASCEIYVAVSGDDGWRCPPPGGDGGLSSP